MIQATITTKISVHPTDPKIISMTAFYPSGLELHRNEVCVDPCRILAGLRYLARHNPEAIVERIIRQN